MTASRGLGCWAATRSLARAGRWLVFACAVSLGGSRPAAAQQGQTCGVGRPCPNGFSCSNLAGNALTGWGRCNRDRPRGAGEACVPGVAPCGPGLNCGGLPLRCHPPGEEGQGCDIGRPCRSGLNCEAITQVCRGPGRAGDPCHATRPCGGGLNCGGIPLRCTPPGTEGQACDIARPCAGGLNCEAITQVCRRPGIVGETCHATRPCGNGLTCQAIGAQGLFKCAQDELDLNSPRPCGAFYVQAVSDLARRAGTAFTWGAGGSGTAGIAAGNLESGVAYGPNGEFGCYATVCAGVATPGFTVSAYAAAGIYNSWRDVAGLAFNLNQSVSVSRALTAIIDIGPGFNISQWLNGDWQLVGTTAGFSMNFGVSVIPVVSLGAAACCTVVAERGASINSLRQGVQNCATTAQTMVGNIASRRPLSQGVGQPTPPPQPPPQPQPQPQPPAPAGGAPGPVVGELQVGSTVGGTIHGGLPVYNGRPTHWYLFRCAPGLSFQVDVTSPWDNVAFVASPEGQQLVYADDNNGTNAQARYTCPSAAPHYIGVGAYGPANVGGYTVQVSGGGAAPPPPQPQPPPPSGGAPGPVVGELRFGGTLGGTLTAGSAPYDNRPVVWYRLQCSPGMPVQVDVTSDWDNVAYVVDGSGRRVAYNDDGNGRNARVAWVCPSAEVHYVGVGAYTGASTGPFVVVASPGGGGAAPAPVPSAPGPLAGEVQVGSVVTGAVTATLPPFGGRPAVWYLFRCSPGVAFTAEATSPWDNVLYVVADGQQVAFNDDASGTNARLAYRCATGGVVFVGVGAYTAANTGAFTLRLLAVAQGGRTRTPAEAPQIRLAAGPMCKLPGATAALAAHPARCTADGVCPTQPPADSGSRVRRVWRTLFGD